MCLSSSDPDPLCFVSSAGRGAVTDRGGTEKDPRGAHEAGAGPPAAAEGGAENHPGEGQVQTQAVLLSEGCRMRLSCPHPAPPTSSKRHALHPPHPTPLHDSIPPAPCRPLRIARFILEVLKESLGTSLVEEEDAPSSPKQTE